MLTSAFTNILKGNGNQYQIYYEKVFNKRSETTVLKLREKMLSWRFKHLCIYKVDYDSLINFPFVSWEEYLRMYIGHKHGSAGGYSHSSGRLRSLGRLERRRLRPRPVRSLRDLNSICWLHRELVSAGAIYWLGEVQVLPWSSVNNIAVNGHGREAVRVSWSRVVIFGAPSVVRPFTATSGRHVFRNWPFRIPGVHGKRSGAADYDCLHAMNARPRCG